MNNKANDNKRVQISFSLRNWKLKKKKKKISYMCSLSYNHGYLDFTFKRIKDTLKTETWMTQVLILLREI